MSQPLDWVFLEPRRQRLHRCGILLVVLGVLCETAGWAWVTGALCIASGGVLIDNFCSKTRLEGKLAGKLGCCGESETAATRDRCCCAPYHVGGLLIASLVFAAIDLLWSVITSATQASNNWRANVPICTDPFYARYNYCDEGFKRGLRYQAVAWVLTVLLSAAVLVLGSVALSAFQQLAANTSYFDRLFWTTTRQAAAATAVAIDAVARAGLAVINPASGQPMQPQQQMIYIAQPAGYPPAPAGFAYATYAGGVQQQPPMGVYAPQAQQQQPYPMAAQYGAPQAQQQQARLAVPYAMPVAEQMPVPPPPGYGYAQQYGAPQPQPQQPYGQQQPQQYGAGAQQYSPSAPPKQV